MSKKDFDDLLRNQYLITSFISPRVDLLNYIVHGYENNLPILMSNRFLHFSAHMFYRSVIIDLYALYGQATNSHKNSFFWIEKKGKEWIRPESLANVKMWLKEQATRIQFIKEIRDKELAHYDLSDTPAINLNFEHLSIINTLHPLAKKIITHCGKNWIDEDFRIGFSPYDNNLYLNDLHDLVLKASR